jgi:hypothetical protein
MFDSLSLKKGRARSCGRNRYLDEYLTLNFELNEPLTRYEL